MRKYLTYLNYSILIALVSYILALLWWQAWMYSNTLGPLPFLHWIIPSDGESSYDLTEYEMFIHVFIVISCAAVFKKKTKSGTISTHD